MATAHAMMDFILSSDSDEDGTEQPYRDRRFGPKPFIPRPNQFPRKDFNFNQFAEMLRTGSHLDPRHKDSRDFRDIFRVPVAFFESKAAWFAERNRRKPRDCVGQPGVTLLCAFAGSSHPFAAVDFKLKILCCFYMLAHGVLALPMSFSIGCDQVTIREFFKWFLRTAAQDMEATYLRFPSCAEDIAACVATYAGENLPGCMGSVDCTHIGWIRAPAAVRSWFIGKEGVPTVAFQVIVDHKCRVLSVSPIFPGSHQDETISRMDSSLQLIRFNRIFTQFPFSLFVSPGRLQPFKGVYLICDSGYQVIRVFNVCVLMC
jgi:hypothetical protein